MVRIEQKGGLPVDGSRLHFLTFQMGLQLLAKVILDVVVIPVILPHIQFLLVVTDAKIYKGKLLELA